MRRMPDDPTEIHKTAGKGATARADVRTFWRLNRADATVVRGMNVADFESGRITSYNVC